MLDGLLKTKFYSRCKSDIKQTRTRIEMIMKKRNAMQKYLRNDIADLLKNGLDTNAYGRAEGLVNELNRSSCFEFVDQYCVTIADNLGTMDKKRECPQECREAVASLMFAAARFAELPELRQLRSLFSERYANSLDVYVDKQFMEKLKSSHPSKEMKLQLLQDIAVESGVEWSSKALENKIYHETAGKKKYTSEGVPIKDIQVDTIVRNETYNQPEYRVPNEEKPLKYLSIPPPYIISDVKRTTSQKKEEPKEADDQEYPTVIAKPGAKSVRRRPAHENEQNSKERNKEQAVAQGQRVLKFLDDGDNNNNNEPDEEEKMMDNLLLHYSRKKTPHGTFKSDSNIKQPPNRISSLPGNVTSPTGKPHIGHARAFSLQPEMLNGNGHVHPKLPDYDDFVARLAALRGN